MSNEPENKMARRPPVETPASTAGNGTGSESSAPGAGRWLTPGVCVFLALATWVVFSPAVWYEFVSFDDDKYVYDNPIITSGLTWPGVAWAFTHFHFGNWHPLTTLSHMLDCRLWGLEAGGHHFTSILIHGLNAALLFLVLKGMTGALWRSAMVAALFAWHPLHVEPVVWISSRKDVLSTCFGLLALIFYVRYAQLREGKTSNIQPSTFNIQGHYWLALFCFVLGLMSKAMLVTLPFLMLLLDWWPLRRISNLKSQISNLQRLVWEKIPFFVLALVFSGVAFVAQRGCGAISSLEVVPLYTRLANVSANYAGYLLNTVWPAALAIPYPVGPVSLWRAGGGFILLLVGTVLVVRAMGSRPWLAVGWFWYLIALLPVIGFVPVGAQVMADRYTYLPLVGIFILAVEGGWQVLGRLRSRRIFVVAGAVIVLGLSLAATIRQLPHWANSVALFEHAVAVTARNSVATELLAIEFYKQGRVGESIRLHQQALQFKPDDVEACNNLGTVLFEQGWTDEAVLLFERALALKPDYEDPWYNLALVFVAQGRAEEAGRFFQKALALKPDYLEAHYNLALLSASQGRLAEAVKHYQRALELKPDLVEAHNNLGAVFFKQGRLEAAARSFEEALRLRPDYADAHYNLAVVLARQGRTTEAIAHCRRTLELKPDYAEAKEQLRALNGGVAE